ncbi:NHL repeat-containing protein [Anaeromicropila herbilytica]|uniref:Gluconolactonase n=1 Tax=Anaeromicropila herbilytica TaxID=2785025 RepID=A0A7R7IC94_9FIRM|nr:NHL repeat-containing protein [Anaeromicropila herbilytica]BCN29631.1 hypothetical protein bsdtb5_09260 [Anaeromicropila herbilytica]
MRKKRLLFIPLMIALMLTFNTIAYADDVPYDTYNYDSWGDIVYTPAAYVPEKHLSGADLGIGNFVTPQDFYVTDDGYIYVADTGNNRIVVTTKDWKLVKVIDQFMNDGKKDGFKSPSGIYVTKDKRVYIADTDNNRVVALKDDGSLYQIISNPKSEVLADNFVFTPQKVTVDYANRVYVIAKGMFQGIMAFDETGNFTSFSGTINVQITTLEKIWRKFSTKAQRSRQSLFIPTEFTGIDVDSDGFVFATNVDNEGTQAVRRLNPKGQDVIDKNDKYKLGGDLIFRLMGDYSGASHISDIVVREKGIYSVVDSTRGRIFTYDHEGNLLYIFGGLGSQMGTFKMPTAIEKIDDNIAVLDSTNAEVLTFSETEYGKLINEAVGLRYDGDETKAVEKWKQVLKLDSNYELAYVGIGKSYLAAGKNKLAMKYLKLGMNKEYYSIAFKRYRNDILKDNLGYILTGVVVIIAGYSVVSRVKKHKREEQN